MAKYRVCFPYVLRELVFEIGQHLDMDLGIPMNAELPEANENRESKGKAKVHFPWTTFVADIEVTVGHYGQYLQMSKLRGTLQFQRKEDAMAWYKERQQYAGDFEHEWDEQAGKLRFTLEGTPLDRLAMNASNRRNGLPTYKWDDPEHPFIKWAERHGKSN